MIFIEKRKEIIICNIWVLSQTWLKAPALSEQSLLPLLPLLVKQRRNCWTPAVNFRPPPQFNSISPLQFNLQPSHWKFHKFPEEFVQRHSSFLQPVHSQTPKCQRISIGLLNEQVPLLSFLHTMWRSMSLKFRDLIVESERFWDLSKMWRETVRIKPNLLEHLRPSPRSRVIKMSTDLASALRFHRFHKYSIFKCCLWDFLRVLGARMWAAEGF